MIIAKSENTGEDFCLSGMDKVISLMYEYGYEILDMELCAAEKHKTKFKTISKQTVSGYEIIFGKKNIESITDYNSKIKYALLLDLFGYKDMSLYLNDNFIKNVELESYLVESSSFKNNLGILFRKLIKIFLRRVIGEPYFKINA